MGLTCLFVRAGHRRRGIGRALARAAVDLAGRRGARGLEPYALTTTAAVEEEVHVGTTPTYEAGSMRQVASPTPRRSVMRVDLR